MEFLVLILVSVIFFGCATSHVAAPANSYVTQQPGFSLPSTVSIIPSGVYHFVKKGETIWRIARAYQVSPEEIIRVNRLPDATKIKTGQRIFIPGASGVVESAEKALHSTSVGQNEDFIWPAKGKILGYFDEKGKEKNINKGINIGLSVGTPIVAVRAGKVSFVHERLKGLGKTVIVEHGDGYQTVYGHLSEVLVIPGEMVEQGKTIGRSGNTGRTMGPSLHFEIRRAHRPKNPLYYLP